MDTEGERKKTMTERLYEKDPYCREFQGRVLSCEPAGEEYEAVLDRTCFYPEGGGQPGDRGILVTAGAEEEQIPVLDTTERDGKIYHRVGRQLKPGTEIRG